MPFQARSGAKTTICPLLVPFLHSGYALIPKRAQVMRFRPERDNLNANSSIHECLGAFVLPVRPRPRVILLEDAVRRIRTCL